MFTVTLSSVGNPDFGQYAPLSPCRTVRVADLHAASAACMEYIAEWDLGGGNWSGGEVRDAKTKKVVARVSYNGRVWAPGDYPTDEIITALP